MLHKHALKAGVVAATVLGIAFTACNDDNNPTPTPQRSKAFKLKGTGADATRDVATVTVTENRDSSVTVVLSLAKNVKDTLHQLYFIGGTKEAPVTDTLLAKEIKGAGSTQSVELFKDVKTIKLRKAAGVSRDTAFRYDNAINYAAYLKVMHSRFVNDTIAIGNFGKGN